MVVWPSRHTVLLSIMTVATEPHRFRAGHHIIDTIGRPLDSVTTATSRNHAACAVAIGGNTFTADIFAAVASRMSALLRTGPMVAMGRLTDYGNSMCQVQINDSDTRSTAVSLFLLRMTVCSGERWAVLLIP